MRFKAIPAQVSAMFAALLTFVLLPLPPATAQEKPTEQPSQTAAAYSIPPNKLWRVNGQNREHTAVLSANVTHPTKSNYVLIASSDQYADALSASVLAEVYNAPILLTSSKKLGVDTVKELNRLKPKYLIIVGGTSVVSNTVERALKKWGQPFRLWGPSRQETSGVVARDVLRIHEQTKRTVDTVIVATSNGYADAISASGLSQQQRAPILLTNPAELHPYNIETLSMIKPKNIVVIGGSKAVGDDVRNKLKSFAPNLIEIAGNDRFETNLRLNAYTFSQGYKSAVITSGVNWPDALTAGPLAAKRKAPIFLTQPEELNRNLLAELTKQHPKQIVLVGGRKALTPQVYVDLMPLNDAATLPCIGQQPDPNATPSASPSVSPTGTPTPVPSVTASPTSSPSGSATPTATASPTSSPSGSATPTATASPTSSPSGSATPTATASPTSSPTASPTGSATPTASESPQQPALTEPVPPVVCK